MSRLPYRIPRSRSANVIAANPERMESADGTRWACGRNVKVSTGRGTYDAVEVWTLKTRDEAGKAITVAQHVDREMARQWTARDGLDALKRWVRNGL